MFETDLKIKGKALTVQAHDFPHFEEGAAIALIDWCGSSDWIKEWCPDGVCQVGFGGGPFDDHSLSLTKEERNKTSSFDLVAKSMGVADNEEIAHIIKYINFEDNNNSRVLDTLARVAWIMQLVWPEEEVANINWAIQGLELKFDDQNDNFSIGHIAKLEEDELCDELYSGEWLIRGKRALVEFEVMFDKAENEYLIKKPAGHVMTRLIEIAGEVWPVIGIDSDNFKMSAYLRSKKGPRAGVVVIKNSKGHHLIAVNDISRASLREPIAILRGMTEITKCGHVVSDRDELRKPLTIVGTEEWHYHDKAERIHNGTPTHPDVPPSQLKFSDIFNAVCLGLSEGLYHPKFADDCKKGKCAGEKCFYFNFGLDRCPREEKVVEAA